MLQSAAAPAISWECIDGGDKISSANGNKNRILLYHVIMLCRRNIATWPGYMGIGRDA